MRVNRRWWTVITNIAIIIYLKNKIKVVNLPINIPRKNDGGMDRRAIVLAGKKQNNIYNTPSESYVYVSDIALNARVNRDSLEHGLSHKADNTALATMSVGDLLANSIAVNELNARKTTKKETEMSYVLLAVAQNKNDSYAVRIIVDKNTNTISEISMYGLYGIRAKKEGALFLSEDNEGVENTSVPYLSSYISISDLLQKVKSNKLINEILANSKAKW